mgnify:FL=1
MTYEESVSYLLDIPRFSRKTSLENLKKLLKILGDPQEQVKAVHIAGTNGKGSVCSFLNTMLIKSQKSVGLFTSPHLVHMNERIRINGEMISNQEFTDVFEKVKNAVAILESRGGVHPSFFEYLFVMAAAAFAGHGVEYAIFETGLGGRLDATNVLKKPVVTVITSLSLDHTEILGNTIGKIAAEKGGIIKEGVPLVYYYSGEEAGQVIQDMAQEKHAPLAILYPQDVKLNEISSKQVDFSLNNRYYKCDNVKVNFPAPYQAMNCSLALMTWRVLKEQDALLGAEEAPERYVCETHWEGRMEEIRKNVFLDGAHNLSGIREFIKSVQVIPCKKRRILLFGVVCEKDYRHMIQLLAESDMWHTIFVTHINNHRALSQEKTAEIFRQYAKVPVIAAENVGQAYRLAMEEKEEEDILFCAGSLYLTGELRGYLEVLDD